MTLTTSQVIVGGGTAGVALGARLSQYLPSCQVLIVEAGPDGRGVPAIDVPGLKGSTLGSVYDWDFVRYCKGWNLGVRTNA